jgi:hypothetical protein
MNLNTVTLSRVTITNNAGTILASYLDTANNVRQRHALGIATPGEKAFPAPYTATVLYAVGIKNQTGPLGNKVFSSAAAAEQYVQGELGGDPDTDSYAYVYEVVIEDTIQSYDPTEETLE